MRHVPWVQGNTFDHEPSPSEWLSVAALCADRVFWPKVNKGAACWLWTAGMVPTGYGKISIDARVLGVTKQRVFPAHRLAWALANGPIPEGLFILHSCDTPACVNPAHLRPGTAEENYANAKSRGRNTEGPRHGSKSSPEGLMRGEAHYRAKLTEAQVIEARSLFSTGDTCVSLAEKYSVTTASMQCALRGRTWKHLPVPMVAPRFAIRVPEMRDGVEHWQCSSCKVWSKADRFGRSKKAPSGLKSQCYGCSNGKKK